jgi:hypothetical protein
MIHQTKRRGSLIAYLGNKTYECRSLAFWASPKFENSGVTGVSKDVGLTARLLNLEPARELVSV